MNKIKTYSDLLEEKEKLETALAIQKKIIQHDFIEFKEECRPMLHLFSSVNKITARNRSNPLIAVGVNLVGEFFLRNVLLSKSNKIVQFFIPFIAKKAVTYLLSNGLSRLQKRAKTSEPPEERLVH